MKVKNLTPFLFGTCVTARLPPQPEVVAIVRGLFSLANGERASARTEPGPFPQGFMSGDIFRDGDDDRAGELVYSSDFAAYKPRAEVLLKGMAFAPGGAPVTELGVKIAVGSWSKSLRVVGPRVFSDTMAGATISAPLAFTEMPLDYTHSFGGPGYAQNPAGKGFGTAELPNIEAAGAPVRSRRDRLEPAGFGPINPAWPQRRKKLGKEYGRSWAESRAPHYSEDFDWTYFNAAPEDQQLEGYLRGDEEVSLYNVDPGSVVFTSRLPGIRARVFIKDIEGRFREVPMRLDTLLVDMTAKTLALTWRGLDKVREDDLADVKTALVASEPLAEAPLAVEHYRKILEQFEADPLELKERVPEEYRQFVNTTDPFAATEAAPPPDSIQAVLEQRLGPAARSEQERLKGFVERVAAASKSSVDIEPLLAKAAREGAPRAAPPLRSAKPGPPPPVRVREAIQDVERTVRNIKRAAAERGITIKNIAELEKLSSDPRLLKLDPSLGISSKSPPPEPRPGQDLSGQDLRGRDLRGRDLRGANFTGALLSEADLRGATLAGATFKLAILFSASLDGADLSGADLTMANLARARAPGANMRGARLDQALFDEADLTGAVLADATGESAFFTNCRMSDLKAARARLTQVFVEGSILDRADFSEAHLVRSRFLRSVAAAAKLDGAMLTKTSFSDSNFTDASFAEVWGEGSIWLRANLARADFSYASLISAHLTEASAPGAKFNAANMKRARLYRAKLDGASFVQANLFEADLCKTSLTGVKFTGANLYGARLLQASGTGADFTGANLKRSTLERAL